MAALRSPCDPVANINRFSRGTCSASSGLISGGKSLKTPVSTEASIILLIALPRMHTERPDLTPASANVFNRATLDPNVVATTSRSAFSISSCSGMLIDSSERPSCFEKTFVLSQIRAFMPLLEIFRQASLLNGSPTPGVSSILKSPV